VGFAVPDESKTNKIPGWIRCVPVFSLCTLASFGGMMNKPKDSREVESKTIHRPITYSFAAPADKNQIRRLLSECGLPTLYVHRHLKSFIVAKAAKKIVGVIGLEGYGRVGLLRSLCVGQGYRGRGIAKMLNAKILGYAQMRGIDRLYMFTLDAEKFASKLGFHKIDKNRIPKSIRSTWQFRSLNSYPFVCMMKKIST
jgi:amino-acid N-acetyltransferase